jgi:hypothetical protein
MCGGCGGPMTKRKARMDEKQKPIVKDDGSLLFTKIAPALPGYRHDPDNPKRLIADLVACFHRLTLPMMLKDGTYRVVNQCNNPVCQWRGKEVDNSICKDCPLRNV